MGERADGSGSADRRVNEQRERLWEMGLPDFDFCLAIHCIVCQRAGCNELTYYWGDWMYHGRNYEKRAPVAVGGKLHEWVRSIHAYERLSSL